MDANKKNFIQKKLSSMDDQYWMRAVEHLSFSSKQLDMLYEQQKAAFTSYCVACFEIVEAKYHGYLALSAEALSAADEAAIENEYKLKLKNLELEQQGYIKQIEGLHSQLFGFTQQPFPLEKYNNDLTHRPASKSQYEFLKKSKDIFRERSLKKRHYNKAIKLEKNGSKKQLEKQ